MGRKPKRERPRKASVSGTDNREKAINALRALLSEQRFEAVGFADIAERAGLSLAELRTEFPSKLAMLAARNKDIDRAVLGGTEADTEEEPARDRLFDVLMRRFEAMAGDQGMVRELMHAAMRHPSLAFALNGMAVTTQQWMLEAAGIGASGPKGILRAQGIALLFARVARVWVDDDDEGLARTMAALDRELNRAARWAGFLDDLCMIPETMCRIAARRPRRRPRGEDDETVEAA
ncbi:MAG TPA: helix-turn-helix domain-containing protein [Pseudolabrys sp.]|nr:helix-turn-helix domain-containing protein [Pseudolabrys sp.]